MLGIDLGRIKRRLGLLQRRVDQLKRGEPISSSAVLHHSAESALASVSPSVESGSTDWRSIFSAMGEALTPLRGVADAKPIVDLIELGKRLGDAGERPNMGEHDAGLASLYQVIRPRFQELLARHQRSATREQHLDQIATAHQRIITGSRLNRHALDAIVDDLMRDVDVGMRPELDFRRHVDSTRNLAKQAFNIAELVVFLSRGILHADADRRGLVLAALLMDAPLIETLGMTGAAAEERWNEHPSAGMKALSRLGYFNVETLHAVGQHHVQSAPRKSHQHKAAIQTPLASVLSVAVSYVHHRWARPDGDPCESRSALRQVLVEAESGVLDLERTFRLLDMSFFPVDSLVELTGGQWAKVIATQKVGADLQLAARPIVRVFRHADGTKPSQETIWNLAQRPDCRVVGTLSPTKVEHWICHDSADQQAFPFSS